MKVQFGFGGIKMDGYYFIDQLNVERVRVYRSVFKSYLKKNYGITINEYYNIVVYGDKQYVHCILSSDRVTIANIERDIKVHFDTTTEYFEFNKIRDIFNFIKNYFLVQRLSKTHQIGGSE